MKWLEIKSSIKEIEALMDMPAYSDEERRIRNMNVRDELRRLCDICYKCMQELDADTAAIHEKERSQTIEKEEKKQKTFFEDPWQEIAK